MQLTLSFESASLEFLCKYHMKTKEHKLRHSELQIIDLGNPSLNSKSLRKKLGLANTCSAEAVFMPR